MIVRPRPNFLQLLYTLRGSILPRIVPQILGLAAYSAVIVALVKYLELDMSSFTLTPFGLLGVALSIYLGFRNSAAYDRWWEARKLWGQVVFDIRNLGRLSNALISDRVERRALLMDSLAFAHFLRGALRNVDVRKEVRPFIGDAAEIAAATASPADAMLRSIGHRVARQWTDGAIDAIGYRIFDERLAAFAKTQAGCERIGGTPLPFAYTLLLHRTAYVFCLLLPVGLVSTAEWATPMFTALVAYTFFGLDALSEELEDPFGTEANDLALDALCRVCEISVFEALEEPAPPMLPASRYYLS